MDKRLDRSFGLFAVSFILILTNYYFLQSIFLIYLFCVILLIIALVPILYFTFDKKKSFQLKELSKIDTSTDFQFVFYLSELMRLADYTNITFARQYGDSSFDIIANLGDDVVGVKCFLTKEKIDTEALQLAKEEQERLAIQKTIVATNDGFSVNAIRFAEKNSIELWNRKELGYFLDKEFEFKKSNSEGDSRDS